MPGPGVLPRDSIGRVSVEAPPEVSRLTPGQRERRQRIIESALALAAEGGYEAVQMREVAARANVALGTLYRYFTSKEHLLVACMSDTVAAMRQRFGLRPPAGEDAAARVIDTLRRATRAMQRQPNVTSAMLKSLISSGGAVSENMEPIGEMMTEIVVGAMGEPARPNERDVAEVIQQVWLAALLWWVAGLAPAREVEEKVNRAVVLLLRKQVGLPPHPIPPPPGGRELKR
jgi:TetR/AcrR family transcriptional regulator, cholesterol catabolism regulator